MITNERQAVRVQKARRLAGLKGRSKAVRRWFKREYGTAVDASGGKVSPGLRADLEGNFAGCRSHEEARNGNT